MKIFYMLPALIFLPAMLATAQVKKNPDNSLFPIWEACKSISLSSNGHFVAWEQMPNVGDSRVILFDVKNNHYDTLRFAVSPGFSVSENFIACTIKPPYKTLRALKVKKTRPDEMPKDTLLIRTLDRKTEYRFSPVRRYKIAEEGGESVAILFDKIKPAKDSKKEDKKTEKKEVLPDSSAVKQKPDSLKKNDLKPKSKRKAEGTDFYVFKPTSDDTLKLREISDFAISADGKLILAYSNYSDSLDSCRYYLIDPVKLKIKSEARMKGTAASPACARGGELAAMLLTTDTAKTRHYNLLLWKDDRWNIIADSAMALANNGFEPQDKGGLYFSENGKRLIFSLSEPFHKNPKDSIPDDEKYSLDLWSWQDARLQSEQLNSRKTDEKYSITAIYHLSTGKVAVAGNPDLKTARIGLKGDAPYTLITDREKYEIEASHTVHAPNDYYFVNLESGDSKLLLTGCRDKVISSPSGRWVIYYSYNDSLWYSLDPLNNTRRCLTKGLNTVFYDFENDVPAEAEPLGIGGWTTDEKFVVIYDKTGFWLIDPAMTVAPFRPYIAMDDANQVLRIRKTDSKSDYLSLKKEEWLTYYNRKTRQECIGTIILADKKIKLNLPEDFSFQLITKAENSDAFVFMKSNYQVYPDLHLSSIRDMKKERCISSVNAVFKDYHWGKVQLVKYHSRSGKTLEGLLYTPDSINPNRKYPMIVYFYEKYSDKLHQFYGPGPSRSVISFPFYTGNDYVVFVPDIVYENGKPGESAYDCIMGGVDDMLRQFSFIDSTRMGLQGQSWGGYQTAYMVTRTDRFKAAMAGAPVVNMTSAYGGIRWESGVVRQFQYEEAQSRIGKTLWDGFDLYVANSPLFGSDKITTPLLIMSNDNDGAVPYYQGIEWITALRRLQKPAWMLCYNNDEHNLMKYPNRVDLSIRMQQFFDHYLKGTPAPLWMKEGIKAVEKGIEDKYETE